MGKETKNPPSILRATTGSSVLLKAYFGLERGGDRTLPNAQHTHSSNPSIQCSLATHPTQPSFQGRTRSFQASSAGPVPITLFCAATPVGTSMLLAHASILRHLPIGALWLFSQSHNPVSTRLLSACQTKSCLYLVFALPDDNMFVRGKCRVGNAQHRLSGTLLSAVTCLPLRMCLHGVVLECRTV